MPSATTTASVKPAALTRHVQAGRPWAPTTGGSDSSGIPIEDVGLDPAARCVNVFVYGGVGHVVAGVVAHGRAVRVSSGLTRLAEDMPVGEWVDQVGGVRPETGQLRVYPGQSGLSQRGLSVSEPRVMVIVGNDGVLRVLDAGAPMSVWPVATLVMARTVNVMVVPAGRSV